MRLTPGHKLAPPEPSSIWPSLPTSQHSVSRATSLRVGGPPRPTQELPPGNGSKDQGPSTSPIWRIFLVAKVLPAVANFREKLSEKPHERANRLTIRRLIAM